MRDVRMSIPADQISMITLTNGKQVLNLDQGLNNSCSKEALEIKEITVQSPKIRLLTLREPNSEVSYNPMFNANKGFASKAAIDSLTSKPDGIVRTASMGAYSTLYVLPALVDAPENFSPPILICGNDINLTSSCFGSYNTIQGIQVSYRFFTKEIAKENYLAVHRQYQEFVENVIKQD